MATIQIVKFRLAPGVDPAEFRTLNERFQREVVPTLKGLERREATVGADGDWMLVLRYSDGEHARQAGRSDNSEISRGFMQMIDMSSMSATFFEIVSQ